MKSVRHEIGVVLIWINITSEQRTHGHGDGRGRGEEDGDETDSE